MGVSVHQLSGSLMSIKSYSYYSPATPAALALIVIFKTEQCLMMCTDSD